MKILTLIFCLVFILIVNTSSVLAAPFNAHDKNPNVVSYYETGLHGIVGEFEDHKGMDLVMMAGKSGKFHQWFYGTSATDGMHGVHTLWKVAKNGECSKEWTKISSPHPEWGEHFLKDTDYCVHSNLFKVSKK